MELMKKTFSNSIVDVRAFDMALRIIEVSRILKTKKEFEIGSQLLESGTSVGANIREALQSDSIRDYSHTMNLAQKECAESLYWIELIQAAKILPDRESTIQLQDQCTEILRMLRSIVRTAKRR